MRLIGHHAGITLGFYGTSHHATEDLAIMRSIADLTVVAPADAVQLHGGASCATVDHPGPDLLPHRARARPAGLRRSATSSTLGRAIVHREGDDLTIIATGSTRPSRRSGRRDRSSARASRSAVIDMHTVKPLDARGDPARRGAPPASIMTVEEHNVLGGLGGAVAEVLAEHGVGCRLHRHGIPDEYSLIGPPTHLYRHYRLDAEGIAPRGAPRAASRGG